jgi:group I intron endonuclease
MIGIYKIENIVNKKVYIGQSWNILKRWRLEKSGYAVNEYLKRSFLKYGKDSFKFSILQELLDMEASQETLDELEKKYIEIYESSNITKGYNIREGGSRGRHSIISKEKNRQAHLGKIISEETRKKMSKAHIGNKSNLGKKLTKEHIANVSKGMYKKVICLETKEVFESLKKAGEKLGIHPALICTVCKGNQHTTHGYHFEYYKEI